MRWKMTVAPDGTVYIAVGREDGSYVVEIFKPNQISKFVEGFKSRAEAEQWIYANVTKVDTELHYAGPG